MSDEPARPLPDCYRVEPGPLLAGGYPGGASDEQTRRRLRALLDVGVGAFFDLTAAGEYGLARYDHVLRELAPSVSWSRHAIPDFGVPSVHELEQVLVALDDAVADGLLPYVHCYGGIGRTGTVVGCYLVRHGRSGREALDLIADWRRGCVTGRRRSPETDEQIAFVLSRRAERE
jgi:protein-tyrosine phosphatase